MLSVALTGNIGAGKSTVAELFRGWGATIIDADQLVRELQAPGHPVLAEIARRFGREVIASDGNLDRERLRARILSDAEALALLNRIVHPAAPPHPCPPPRGPPPRAGAAGAGPPQGRSRGDQYDSAALRGRRSGGVRRGDSGGCARADPARTPARVAEDNAGGAGSAHGRAALPCPQAVSQRLHHRE